MTSNELRDKMDKNNKYIKHEYYCYNIFEVEIAYFCGLFSINIRGGDYDMMTPEYGFGTDFSGNKDYYSGFNKAIKIALSDIRKYSNGKIRKKAESALFKACREFRQYHSVPWWLQDRLEKGWCPKMFEYTVWWLDANGAGEQESGIQYRGTDREEALKAKRTAEEKSCGGWIDIRLLWKKESRGERFERLAIEAEEQEYWDNYQD